MTSGTNITTSGDGGDPSSFSSAGSTSQEVPPRREDTTTSTADAAATTSGDTEMADAETIPTDAADAADAAATTPAATTALEATTTSTPSLGISWTTSNLSSTATTPAPVSTTTNPTTTTQGHTTMTINPLPTNTTATGTRTTAMNPVKNPPLPSSTSSSPSSLLKMSSPPRMMNPGASTSPRSRLAPPPHANPHHHQHRHHAHLNWEPIRQRLLGPQIQEALAAAKELQQHIEIVHSTEFPLMLSALLPAFSSLLMASSPSSTPPTAATAATPPGRTRPHPDPTSLPYQLRYVLLDILVKMPVNEILRPHAPHLVAVAVEVLQRDYEEPALLASRLLFDLYKTYRHLPPDHVQPYLDFVVGAYQQLPAALTLNFGWTALSTAAAGTRTTSSSASVLFTSSSTTTTSPEWSDLPAAASPVAAAAPAISAAATPEMELVRENEPVAAVAPAPTDAVGGTLQSGDDDVVMTETADAVAATPPAATSHDFSPPLTAVPPPPIALAPSSASMETTGDASVDSIAAADQGTAALATEKATSPSTPPSTPRLALRANVSFRVLTECPLCVMLMFQLYPKFMKNNIPILIKVMMEALALKAPSLSSMAPAPPAKVEGSVKRLYASRARELVAAQAKTLSFLTYLLRTFSAELKPYEDRLAAHVVSLMSHCPREAVATRKELLVATRHLLSSDFRQGFLRHVDVLLDERVLMGPHFRWTDQTALRPLGYTTLSDYVQHVRQVLTVTQMSKVVSTFSRVLHDTSSPGGGNPLPMSTQFTAVRTLLSLVDIIYHNKDPNPQLGRDLLVRILDTMLDKLEAINATYPSGLPRAPEASHQRILDPGDDEQGLEPTYLSAESTRDLQSMVRAIIVGHKTVIAYINSYRNQRDKDKPRDQLIPPGSNEDVSSALMKLTHTEAAIIDRYILAAFPAMKIIAAEPSASDAAADVSAKSAEKSTAEHHRDALTYFAATFTALDGHNLRRTLGRRLDVLVNAIVDDPVAMVVPRHLLQSNPSSSFEFCSILLDYLVERMDLLSDPQDNFLFFDSPPDGPISPETMTKHIEKISQRNVESDKKKGAVFLQLFERILKSLSTYPENEPLVRRHLRRIVFVCLRSSMENTSLWPDNYCMLLRYIFRSVSAGKFEESYKELRPLIPSVLNGLYRIISVSDDTVLKRTAIELCLTIPARLSSLLPHMNLLLRIIIPALSGSGELVNLGLRTLEFWVDNLNPQFLYPEMSKQTELFSALMHALSRHLRPAPYPYGLLTLRLLGKLGGRNRQFLRDPTSISDHEEIGNGPELELRCSWKVVDRDDASSTVLIPFQLRRLLDMLRLLSRSQHFESAKLKGDESSMERNSNVVVSWNDFASLWNCRLSDIDFESYCRSVGDQVRTEQAVACLTLVRTAAANGVAISNSSRRSLDSNYVEEVCIALQFATTIRAIERDAKYVLADFASRVDHQIIASSIVRFLAMPDSTAEAGIAFLSSLLHLEDLAFSNRSYSKALLVDSILEKLCASCTESYWSKQGATLKALCVVVDEMGSELSMKHELKLVNAAFSCVKSTPRELSHAAVESLQFFVHICLALYDGEGTLLTSEVTWDALAFNKSDMASLDPTAHTKRAPVARPSEQVLRLVLQELVSPQHIVRFAARFIFTEVIWKLGGLEGTENFAYDQVSLVRKVLFSRSLRLVPLPQQVGVVEGLAAVILLFPKLFTLSDPHLLAFLSELLKIFSVADGEMNDSTLKGWVVDKNGFTGQDKDPASAQQPSHASTLFFRRCCVTQVRGCKIVVPEELPAAVQLRVSGIDLLHIVIHSYGDVFFDADTASPTGNIRPHVVSLFFRSLVSTPAQAVDKAHFALRDVLALSVTGKPSDESRRSQSRLPKELLQTCIRPVLLHLRDYTRLSVPLLRGLSRLLALLSSWFNKTLGDKLLDHLQKWTDPSRLISQKIWKEGDEPSVAASIVDVFALLPHSSHFVEPLVKTCIKLEATLPSFNVRLVESPYRRPLARYLDKHPEYTVSFFFQRLKTPMYSELFQSLLQTDECHSLRSYLSNKQCSLMILNVCFEKPLTIIRSEQSANVGGSSKASMFLHGIGQPPTNDETVGTTSPRPMSIELMELQYQGFRLVNSLLTNNNLYFMDHNDIVRAFRWLWRSKGRFLRLQHEDMVSPRYRHESRLLANFLTSYAKAFPNEDLDILFELIRVFLHPSTTDFSFVQRFLDEMVSSVLSLELKRQVLQRFFALSAGDGNEETKALSIQFIVIPMLLAESRSTSIVSSGEKLVDVSVIEKFVKEIILKDGNAAACGDRLKVELLRLCHVFATHFSKETEVFKNDFTKFCWSLLKSEDSMCKNWAYVVLCRLIKAFETPVKITAHLYSALLKAHQPEGKDLVRRALNILVPALPSRLPEEDLRKAIEQTSQVLLEEGNSAAALSHICQTVVNHSDIFRASRSRFVGYIINSLNRLGLPPNSPLESKVLALDAVDTILDWGSLEASDSIIQLDQMDTVLNFLVRLKILVAEPPESRTQKSEYLDTRAISTLRRVLPIWHVPIRPSPLEKVVGMESPSSRILVACMEILSVIMESKRSDVIQQHSNLVRRIISMCIRRARDDVKLQDELQRFTLQSGHDFMLETSMLIWLEKVLMEVADEQKKVSQAKPSDSSKQGSTRSKDKASSSDDGPSVGSFECFALNLIDYLCHRRVSNIRLLTTSLLTLTSTLAKNHLNDAASKQRQGSSNVVRPAPPGVMHCTPTVGILDELCNREPSEQSKLVSGKYRPPTDNSSMNKCLESLIKILSIFELSDIMYSFTASRKVLFQIVGNILETSDNVQLLMVAVRCVGKWLLNGVDCPITMKERNSLVSKLAAFDYSALPDDLAAQPLADLVGYMTMLIARAHSNFDAEIWKVMGACLLNANSVIREDLVAIVIAKGLVPGRNARLTKRPVAEILWQVLHIELDGLGGRFWIVLIVDLMLQSLEAPWHEDVAALRVLSQGDPSLSVCLFRSLLPSAWLQLNNNLRLRLIPSIELILARPYHAQFLLQRGACNDVRCVNAVRAFLNAFLELRPLPLLNTELLVSLAENYNSWYEVITILEYNVEAFGSQEHGQVALAALRHCYRQLGDEGTRMCLASRSCLLARTQRAVSCDLYGFVNEALEEYYDLVESAESAAWEPEPSVFEMNFWEERWITLQKELCQLRVVSEYAKSSSSALLHLECAWKTQDWPTVRRLCSSSALLAEVESGSPLVKLTETLLAVAEGLRGTDVENLHAQTAQLCLYRWQLLPRLSSGSHSHALLFHLFHRLVEIRESGQIMVETSNHSNGRTLPDLKNLLNAWRHRLPNDFDTIASWDEIFSWRAHMFTSITSNFQHVESSTLATLHDKPWTTIRIAKAARKHSLRDASLFLLNKDAEERAMNVSDAFLKLREQILAYYNPANELERYGGLNLINTTNLAFFDASQKSEIFRLKALFLASLGSRPKASQAYFHSIQIYPAHSRAWANWGDLCAQISVAAEKQLEQSRSSSEQSNDGNSSPTKKVAQYLAQAMGCYLEAVHIDGHEWSRLNLPKCLWMLSKDGSSPGLLSQTLETRGSQLPAWVWLPWIPQLLTSLYRVEGRAVKAVFANLVKSYPQAVYYALRAFYLERRDVERAKSSSPSSAAQHMGSVTHAEEMMSLLRRSHASLWSSLEAILEELIVKFRPSYEEELLSTIAALLERAESQFGSGGKGEEEESVISTMWKTLSRIAAKFFRPPDSSGKNDERARKTALFRETFKDSFESDFNVSASDDKHLEGRPTDSLDSVLEKLRSWKRKLENYVVSMPTSLFLMDSSHSLAMFGIGDAPDLWPGSCDPRSLQSQSNDREVIMEADPAASQPSTSSSAEAARKAAATAASTAALAAANEGIGGDYGGGSSYIEIPGQYAPNSSTWADVRPSPELHAKLLKFEPIVRVLRRNDQLVRRIGMVASDGQIYRFLINFSVPLGTRTDERVSQTYFVLDKVLRKDIRSLRWNLSVQSHPVIPVAQRLRLICEPETRTSMEDIFRDYCAQKSLDHAALPTEFSVSVKQEIIEAASKDVNEGHTQSTEREARVKIFQRMSATFSPHTTFLFDHIFHHLKGPESLHSFRRTFAKQWAANCLLQYVFSVAERTPGRVVFVEANGRVLSPDFRVAYNSQGILDSSPLPFRLTESLWVLLGASMRDGLFVPAIAVIGGAVAACRDELDPIFKLLMRDDLVAFYTKSMAKSDSKTQEMERQLVDRIAGNVTTLLSRFAECSPDLSTEKEGPIDKTVRNLIATARSPENLCMMPAHFQAWL